MTAGTALIMWLGELITQRGVGNGMSIRNLHERDLHAPVRGSAILEQGGLGKFIVIMLIGLGIIVAVIYVDQGQRRVPIQYAKRVVGRKMTSGGSTYLPLKVNQAGVIRSSSRRPSCTSRRSSRASTTPSGSRTS